MSSDVVGCNISRAAIENAYRIYGGNASELKGKTKWEQPNVTVHSVERLTGPQSVSYTHLTLPTKRIV